MAQLHIFCVPDSHNLYVQNVIKYPEGASMFFSREDEGIPGVEELEPADEKTKKRLDKLNDMVMFRFGGTGVWQAVQKAAELRAPVVAFPVRSLTNFSADTESSSSSVFGNAILMKRGSTVKDLAHAVHPEVGRMFLYAESFKGRVSEDEELQDGAILKFTTGSIEDMGTTGAGAGGSESKKSEGKKAVSSKPAAKGEPVGGAGED